LKEKKKGQKTEEKKLTSIGDDGEKMVRREMEIAVFTEGAEIFPKNHGNKAAS